MSPSGKSGLSSSRERLSQRSRRLRQKAADMKTPMLNTIIDLENELKEIKKRVKSGEMGETIGEDEIDRLKYIQDELGSVFT